VLSTSSSILTFLERTEEECAPSGNALKLILGGTAAQPGQRPRPRGLKPLAVSSSDLATGEHYERDSRQLYTTYGGVWRARWVNCRNPRICGTYFSPNGFRRSPRRNTRRSLRRTSRRHIHRSGPGEPDLGFAVTVSAQQRSHKTPLSICSQNDWCWIA